MWASINELKERIHADSSEEIVTEYLERISKSKLNAFISVDQERALSRAREIDADEIEGPLAGIPVAIKDNISTKGIQTTCASNILKGYIPPYDAHVRSIRLVARGRNSEPDYRRRVRPDGLVPEVHLPRSTWMRRFPWYALEVFFRCSGGLS